jgi:hypothetical protein
VITTPRIEYCSYLNFSHLAFQEVNESAINLPLMGNLNNSVVLNIVKIGRDFYKETAPWKLQRCPLHEDFLTDLNFSANMKQEFEKFFPSGDYRCVHRFWNSKDDNIFTKFIYERFQTMEDSFF